MWQCDLSAWKIPASLLSFKWPYSEGNQLGYLLRYPWLLDSWKSWVLAGSSFGLWCFQLENGNRLYDHWDGFHPSTTVHQYSFKTSTDFKHFKFNLVCELAWTHQVEMLFGNCFCVKQLSYTLPLFTSPKKLIQWAMVPFEVSTDHNWRWHIRDTELPPGVSKKWALSCVHRTKHWLLWLGNKVMWSRLTCLSLHRKWRNTQNQVLHTQLERGIFHSEEGQHRVARSHLTALVYIWDTAKLTHCLTFCWTDFKEWNTCGLTSLQWFSVFCLCPSEDFERDHPLCLSARVALALLHLWIQTTGLLERQAHRQRCASGVMQEHYTAAYRPRFSLALTSGDDGHFAKKLKPLCKPPAWCLGGPERFFSATWVSSIHPRVSDCPRTSVCLS